MIEVAQALDRPLKGGQLSYGDPTAQEDGSGLGIECLFDSWPLTSPLFTVDYLSIKGIS